MARKKKVVEPEKTPVQVEYEKILTAAIIKNGSLMSETPSIFSWADYHGDYGSGWPRRGERHSSSCGIASTGRVEEHATWYEFAGTFATSDFYKHGMEVHDVTCNCGKIKNRTFRWDAPVGEAIRAVMMGLLEERVADGQEDSGK